MSVKIKGKKELIKKMNKLGQAREAKRRLKLGGNHVMGKVKKYPPSTEANRPRSSLATKKTLSWYERGYGTKWMRKDGSVGGRKTSENLGRKWTLKTRDSGWSVVIGNNASYSIFVHSEDDQARFHASRGWLTGQQVLDSEWEKIKQFVLEGIRKDWS